MVTLFFFEAPRAGIEDVEDDTVEIYKNCLPAKFTHSSQLLHVGPDWVVCVVEDKKTTFYINPGFSLINVTNQEYSHVGTILARNKKGIR